MFGKSKNYILHTTNIVGEELELVGKEAFEASELAKTGVVMPSSVVLTTEAFDDFITAANIVEQISAHLAAVRPDDPVSASRASEAIIALIMQANFPSIVLNPLVQAYKTLSGFSDKYIAVKPSWNFTSDLIPENPEQFIKLNVKGDAGLLYAVKQIWAALFSPSALELRASTHYQGPLTIAVLIQKMVQAEISGKAYNIDPATSEKVLTIEAILGLDLVGKDQDMIPDVYKVDPADMRIMEKNIVSQDYMILRKGRAKPEEDPNMKVAISPDWKRRQKLLDNFIIDIARITQKLADHYHHDVEVHWAFETGQVNILSATEYKPFKKPQLDIQEKVDKALDIKHEMEILPMAPEVSDLPREKEKTININSLVKEVVDSVNNKDIVPVFPAPEQAPAPIIQMVIDQKIEEYIEAEPRELAAEIEMITNVYLDISDMSTDKLANASRFDGVYLDGTQTVLRNKVLPESTAKNKQEFSHLVESFALEISTAAKVIEPKPIYYAFSDIGDNERKQLAGSTPEAGLNGAERFLLQPEAMIAEILAIKRARSTYGAQNIKLILPRLRSESELIDIKKILSSQNVRRSSVLQLFTEISVPTFMYELDEIKPSELDGIFINFEKLAQAMTGRSKVVAKDFVPVLKALEQMLIENKDKKFTTIAQVTGSKEIISELMHLNIGGLIFTELPDSDMIEFMQSQEKNKLKEPEIKRGRKPKSL